jgi:histidyl-tRNA synthetase
MEIAVPDLPGSLGGGGRYDHLIGMFLGRDLPACGFSLGLERIIFVMNERHMFPDQVARSAVDVMITLWTGPAATPAASRLCSMLPPSRLALRRRPDERPLLQSKLHQK